MGRSSRLSRAGQDQARQAFHLYYRSRGKSQQYLAGEVGCVRQTVKAFLDGKPVERISFQAFCNKLNLKETEVIDLEHEGGRDLENEQSRISTQIENPMQALQENICQANNQQQRAAQYQAIVVFCAKLIADNKMQRDDLIVTTEAAIANLKDTCRLIGDLRIYRIEESSVRITLGGSPEDLEKLQELFNLGELNEVLGIPIEVLGIPIDDIRIVSQTVEGQNREHVTFAQAPQIRENGGMIPMHNNDS